MSEAQATPVSQLPSNSLDMNNDTQDNEIVNEILNEIDHQNMKGNPTMTDSSNIFQRNVDQEIIIISLKVCEDDLKEKIFNSMSQRAAANIKDEMEVLGPIRLTEVQEAQKAVINVARTMSDEGTIVLAGRGGDDFV